MPHTTPDLDPVRPDTARLSRVLAGLTFPVRRWQLIAQADYYGADSQTRTELMRLPERTYPHLSAVIAAISDNPPPSASPPTTAAPSPPQPTERADPVPRQRGATRGRQ